VRVSETLVVRASVDDAWRIAGDPGSLAEWLPGAERLWFDGDVRHIVVAGAKSSERITQRDEAARYYEYEYVSGPAPVRSYTARLSVREHPLGAEILWEGDVTADPADAEPALQAGLQTVYRNGLEGLRQLLEPT
jgi:hypothetical protein